jgi:hypothetical protein
MFCGRPNATGLQLLRDADLGANSPAACTSRITVRVVSLALRA